MIKARGRTGDGKPLVILGLSGEAMARLMADEPIQVNLAEMGLPACLVVIVGGRTELAITQRLERTGLLPPGSAALAADLAAPNGEPG